MSKSIRKALFWIFVLLFLVIGTGVVLYSFGWRFNAENLKIQKIGAIYLKTKPLGVTIRVGGKIYSDQSGIIQNGTLVQNLLPGIYPVEIIKTGYRSYQKFLEVNPSMISKLSKIQLIPEVINPVSVLSIKGNDFIDSAETDSKIIVKNEKGAYYLHDLNKPNSAFNISVAFENKQNNSHIKNLAFVPFNSSQLIIEDDFGLKIMDISSGKMEDIGIKPVVWTTNDSSIYLIKQNKSNKLELGVYNLVFKNYSVVAEIPEIISSIPFIKIKSSSSGEKIALLDLKGGLYLLTKGSDIKEIAHSAKFFAFSPDNKKIAFTDKDGLPAQAEKIGIHFIEDAKNDTPEKAGDVFRFELPNRNKIVSIYWYQDSEHVFIDFGDQLRFMEIDQRPGLNIYTIYSNYNDYDYEPETNTLFLTTNGQLQKINFNDF